MIITNYMVFFCFSSKDRQVIVESLLYHLDNYCIPVWYDRRTMLMSDQRNYKNFVEGVGSCRYAVVILSPNSIASKCANEEIELIKEKYEKGDMTVFPIFFNLSAEDIPEKYLWMTKLVYKELTPSIDSVAAAIHIVCKVLLDELDKYPIKTLNEYITTYEKIPLHTYPVIIIQSYLKTYKGNYNARISLLYSICKYIISLYDISNIPLYYYQGIDHLFSQTKLSLPIEKRELLIMERSFLLLINAVMFGVVIQDRKNNL